MFCCKCDKQFPVDCTCADRDERLSRITGVAMPKCKVCNRHFDLCSCAGGADMRNGEMQVTSKDGQEHTLATVLSTPKVSPN